MKKFSLEEYKLFTAICDTPQPQLLQLLASTLTKANYKVIKTKEYIIAEGTIPICLIAHLDTVFPDGYLKDYYYDENKNVIWSPDGLGADDRAGVFAILKILQSGLRPHILFTTDEEMGGIGASFLVGQDCPFKDVRYFIELDRQGVLECVFYNCNNPDFQLYVESFGFTTERGTFTDISILCPIWGIAGVNLSIGYFNEHSIAEYFNVNYFWETVERVKQMLTVEEYPNRFIYISGKKKRNRKGFNF